MGFGRLGPVYVQQSFMSAQSMGILEAFVFVEGTLDSMVKTFYKAIALGVMSVGSCSV